MAYNKAKAEREWLRWKEAEEKKLRELGVDEETIQRLHTYDWAQFNKERQYLQRQVEWSPYIDWVSAQDLELPVEDTESLLDSIEDIELFSLLHNVDKQNHSLTRLQTKGCIDSALFIERSNRNNQKIEELRRELRQLQGPDQTSSLIDSTKLLLELLEEAQPMLEFEPSIFKSMIQKIIVYPERFCFHLINGLCSTKGDVRDEEKTLLPLRISHDRWNNGNCSRGKCPYPKYIPQLPCWGISTATGRISGTNRFAVSAKYQWLEQKHDIQNTG